MLYKKCGILIISTEYYTVNISRKNPVTNDVSDHELYIYIYIYN